MRNISLFFLILFVITFSCNSQDKPEMGDLGDDPEISLAKIKVSENNRFLMDEEGKPFFWLGDTGWLLFSKLNREEAIAYLDDRAQKGFNVVQVMVLDKLTDKNVYNDYALLNQDVSQPLTTEGSSFTDLSEYDFWDHVDFLIDEAEKRGIYMALVPVWGSNVRDGLVSLDEAKTYAEFLANRYKDRRNIIWVNGGDINGADARAIWVELGKTLRENDLNHLITFHPIGQQQSSNWFHTESWLDFNMFQSGHQNYDQDNSENAYGEDNWRYVESDYSLTPVKPTLDGEPAYEDILQGLHDNTQPYWTDDDVRRYAYWSVFAGSCGFTYGHNSIWQFFQPSDNWGLFGVRKFWTEALDSPGAEQMIHLKKLILSNSYFERVPDQSLVAGEMGEAYDRLLATRGELYAYVYNYTGRIMTINMGKISGNYVDASWYNPRSGELTLIDKFPNSGVCEFDPPGEKENGNDWVLVLESDNSTASNTLPLNESSQCLSTVLYPNPNNGNFNVQLKGLPRDKMTLHIVDVYGRTIDRKLIRNFRGESTECFDLKLASGAYVLHISSGARKAQCQFVIQ